MGPNVSRAVKTITTPKVVKVVIKEPAALTSSVESPISPDASIQLGTSLTDTYRTREYHGVEDSEYFLPSDVDEQDRLELQHYLLRHLFKGDIVRNDIKEFLANTPGSKILDVGCANGWWLDSIGKIYPSAELYGVDLAPSVIEKAEKILPKGHFIAKNVVGGLPYEDNTFDFVHQRYLAFGLQKSQFPGVFRELMRVTKPGGWIELVEADMEFSRCGPIFQNYLTKLAEVMAPRQLDVLAGSNVVKYVSLAAQKTQFLVKKITRTTVSMPINWGGPIGDMVATDFKHAAYNMEDAVYKPLGVEREDFKGYIDKMFEEAKENKTFANTHGVSFQVEKS